MIALQYTAEWMMTNNSASDSFKFLLDCIMFLAMKYTLVETPSSSKLLLQFILDDVFDVSEPLAGNSVFAQNLLGYLLTVLAVLKHHQLFAIVWKSYTDLNALGLALVLLSHYFLVSICNSTNL